MALADHAELAAPHTSTADAANPSARSTAEAAGSAAPLDTLFPPGRVRAILRELATLTSASGEVDVAAAIRLIARAAAIDRLPRLRISRLGHSVHLLFDAGPAMLPFTHDKQQLAATATRLLGPDRVRIADFIGTPLADVRAQHQMRWQPLRWPARHSALVVVSDLGLGSGPDVHRLADAWQTFADQARLRGLRSVLLIPYDRARWPRGASAFGTTLTWDLPSGVQALRRSARRASRVA